MAILLIAGTAAAAQTPAGLPLSVGGAQVRVEWSQVVASERNDWINDLVRLRSGNLLGVGFLNRQETGISGDWIAVAAEFAPNGATVGERRYGLNGAVDAFWAVAEAANGRRTYAGLTTRIGPGGINGYVVVAEADGTIVKENGLGGPGYDRFTDLAPTGDGGHVFLGHSQPAGEEKRRVFVAKLDGGGVPVWERVHDAPETWGALYIEPVADGGYVVAGGMTGGGDSDMFVMKLDADGRELWRRRVGTPDWDEINHGLVVRPDGSMVLVGYTHPRGGQVNDLVAATLAPSGDLLRLERFGGDGDDRAILARADETGTVWVVGQTASAGAGGSDLLLVSLDRRGRFTGTATTIGGPADDNGTAVLPLVDGLAIAGYSRNLGRGGQDAFVAKVSRPAAAPHPALRRTVVRAPSGERG